MGPRGAGRPAAARLPGVAVPTVALERTVDPPLERVFDLARCLDCHVGTMADQDEAAVDGAITGLLDAGDRVNWRARHFGVPLTTTVAVTELGRPCQFRDEQVAGPLATLVHDHEFEPAGDGTPLRDVVRFRSPAGPVGRPGDATVLLRSLRRLLERQTDRLAALVERDGWRRSPRATAGDATWREVTAG